MLPAHIEDDPYEALLYLYYCVNYKDEQLFKLILTRTSNLLGIASEIQVLIKDGRSYRRLCDSDSFDRKKFN
jgi:hypothetical protein